MFAPPRCSSPPPLDQSRRGHVWRSVFTCSLIRDAPAAALVLTSAALVFKCNCASSDLHPNFTGLTCSLSLSSCSLSPPSCSPPPPWVSEIAAAPSWLLFVSAGITVSSVIIPLLIASFQGVHAAVVVELHTPRTPWIIATDACVHACAALQP